MGSDNSDENKTAFNHTPPPWFDSGYRIHAPTSDADKRNGRVIVDYKYTEDFTDEDGALITAAPLMFEKLEAIIADYDRLYEACATDGVPFSMIEQIESARDLIEKIKGEVKSGD